MTIGEIQTSDQEVVCDVCGRTLLRGERAEMYLNDGTRRWVCELCKDRALHEGWVRNGTDPAYDDVTATADPRPSLLNRLRGRRDALREHLPSAASLRDERGSSRSEAGAARDQGPPDGRLPREPRHVRAIPTSPEQRIVSAVGLFNGSEHRRTVAGIARSLGAPDVTVIPSANRPGQVTMVVSWELCWYRYEVDLADDQPSVRGAGRGYELSELAPEELRSNAIADDEGSLALRR
jgi:hypothetical protein